MAENSGIKNLVLTVNKLQESFKRLNVHMDIDLPQIAVVGIQSSGKSSVLEKFVGKDFLPRGSGIVTRRPLILQLIFNESAEYAKFDHSPTIFKDFSRVMKEIEDETDRIAGVQKGISNVPIVLKVFSPNVLNLTLIDLPGITKVPIGDQPSDIEHQIRSMILEFIEKETCLILAVTPATMDLANSEALKLAREVDPHGDRTIGVITKLDLMDQGTNAVDILENRQFHLSRGYVGVVNRSQQSIIDKQDMKVAAEAEQEFFKNHSAYKHMADRMGTPFLQKTLNSQLTDHILRTLPTLRDKMSKLKNELEEDLKDCDSMSDIKMMNEVILSLKKEFRSELDGYGPLMVDTKRMTIGTQICGIYNQSLRNDTFDINFNSTYESSIREEITAAIYNTHGMYSSLFIPEKAFDRTVATFIEKMKQPIKIYVDKISKILQDSIQRYTDKITRYPNLRDKLREIILTYIVEREILCKERLAEMIECEISYINKSHEDFDVYGNGNDKITKVDGVFDNTLHKGFLTISYRGMVSSSDTFWFVLTSDQLSWYKDDTECDLEASVALSSLEMCDCKGKNIKLTEVDGKSIYKGSTSLKLSCKTSEETKEWLQNLNSLLTISSSKTNTSTPTSSMTNISTIGTIRKSSRNGKNVSNQNKTTAMIKPSIDDQVELIKNLLEKYMTIVIKSIKDRIPKLLTCMFINNVNNFIDEELVTLFYEKNLVDYAMQKSPLEQERVAKVKNMYQACKEALEIIDEEHENIKYIKI